MFILTLVSVFASEPEKASLGKKKKVLWLFVTLFLHDLLVHN